MTTTPKTWADVLREVEGTRADLNRAIAAVESRPDLECADLHTLDPTPRLPPAPDDTAWLEVEPPSWPTKPEKTLMLIVFAIGLILGAQAAVFLGWVL